ncbi:unnamed protein product, partial [Urochloa humidicola]
PHLERLATHGGDPWGAHGRACLCGNDTSCAPAWILIGGGFGRLETA